MGEHELTMEVGDLLSAPAEVIVNPANGGLSHGGGLAGKIVQEGGEVIQDESDRYIEHNGMLSTGQVACTSAGRLPFRAVIHAVGPRMGEGGEDRKIAQAVYRSLELCQRHGWGVIAFPAISTGIFGVPIETAACGFYQALSSFGADHASGLPRRIIIRLTMDDFDAFVRAFGDGQATVPATGGDPAARYTDGPVPATGVIELNEEDAAADADDEINRWFNK